MTIAVKGVSRFCTSVNQQEWEREGDYVEAYNSSRALIYVNLRRVQHLFSEIVKTDTDFELHHRRTAIANRVIQT